MKDEKQRKDRLNFMSRNKMMPFDLDFFREVGFEFGLDWDGQVVIEHPIEVSIDNLLKLIMKYEDGIRTRLFFEGQKAKRVFVGGPLNGQSCFGNGIPNQPICRHVKRGEWLVYIVKSYSDPRAWFVGKASSKKKAKGIEIRH